MIITLKSAISQIVSEMNLETLIIYLYIDLLILLKIVDKLFVKLEEVYKDLFYKKYVIEKFNKLKIDLKSFNVFYSKFIKLIAKLEFTQEILL